MARSNPVKAERRQKQAGTLRNAADRNHVTVLR
jgi:hypothetical protein